MTKRHGKCADRYLFICPSPSIDGRRDAILKAMLGLRALAQTKVPPGVSMAAVRECVAGKGGDALPPLAIGRPRPNCRCWN